MRFIKQYQIHLISISIITLVLGFLFYKPLTDEYVFGGVDSLSPGAINQGISLAEVEFGKYPLWLPWVFSGLPSVHSFQNISSYYFPNLISKLLNFLGLPSFWNYILHFIIAGMGVFVILKQLDVNRYSAFFGAISFSLMPYLITMVVHGHGSQMMTSAWIPWVIWGMLRLYNYTSLKNLGILALIIGLQLQRAHVQIAYYTWMAAGLFLIMLSFNFYKKNSNNIKWIVYSTISFLLGLSMAMWIYLPVISYTPYSTRSAGIQGGAGFEYATAWSFSFSEIATFFVPSFFGFGGATYWGSMPFTDYPNYMGIIVIIFSIIGSIFYKGKIKWFFIITAGLALILSFGKHFFLYGYFYNYFPYFSKFRVPVMLLILTQFSISILAGLGLETIFNFTNSDKKKIIYKKIMGIFLSIIIFIFILKLFYVPKLGSFPKYPQYNLPFDVKLYFDQIRIDMINYDITIISLIIFISAGVFHCFYKKLFSQNVLVSIIIIISIIDMARIDLSIIEPNNNQYRSSTLIKKVDQSTYYTEDEIIKYLKNDTSKYRVLPLGTLANENRWSAFGVESIEGYHPAKMSNYSIIKDNVGWSYMGILQMLNVKYLITLDEISHSDFIHVFTGELFHQGKFVRANIYKFNKFLPRAFFAHELHKKSHNNNQIEILKNNNFNPLIHSFIDNDPEDFVYNSNSTVRISYWSPDKIELEVVVPSKQFLIISEIFYPNGWKISSNLDWDIYSVNSILRGLYVPKGKHNIVMEFKPKDIYLGSVITYISTSVILILILLEVFINRRKNVK